MGNSNREFRKIRSLDFLYEINSNGTIFRNVKSKKQGRIVLDFHHSPKGYYFVWINRNRKVQRLPIARLVAECWLGKKPEGYEIDHIDRNSQNNDYRNLRYVTKSQQMKNRDHSNISARGKKNLDAYRKTIMKPVTLIGEMGFFIACESMTAAARYLAARYGTNTEYMRSRLKKHRSRILDFDIIYRNGETGHARPTGQGTVHASVSCRHNRPLEQCQTSRGKRTS